MKTGTRLVLLRHGATAANESGRFQGWNDTQIGDHGRRAVEEAVRRLVSILGAGDIGTIIASDLARARQTAALLPPAPISVEPRLRELNFGAFEGRTHQELLAAGEPTYRRWLDDPERCPPPGGETLDQLRQRVVDWWDQLRSDDLESYTPGGRGPPVAVVVTHAGPIGLLLSRILGPSAPEGDTVPGPGGFVVLRYEAACEYRPGEAGWHVETTYRCPALVPGHSRGDDV